MHRILLPVILFVCLAYADTVYVNTSIYEDRIINLCDEELICNTNEYRFIDIKGYGLLYVALEGRCSDIPMFGIFSGERTYGLAIDPSLKLQYVTQEEKWESDNLPSGLVDVPQLSMPLHFQANFDEIIHHPIVGTLSFHDLVTDGTPVLLQFHESGYWTGDNMVSGSWMNTFGNIGEVFYLRRQGENTVKFQVLEYSQEEFPLYTLSFASDSLGNGKFKIFTTPVITGDPDHLQPTSQTLRFINNKLYLPSGLSTGCISLFNISGQKIFTQTLQGNHVALPNLSRGFYQYSVTGSDGNYGGTFLKLN